MAVIVLTVAFVSGCSFSKNDELNQAALAGDQVRCEALLRRGAKVNGAGMHAMKPIMMAAQGGHVDTVRYLVSQGADVNAHNDSGSALMWAVDAGTEELTLFLLTQGSNASWSNALGRTALDLAGEQGRTNLVSLIETWSKRTRPDTAPNAPRR